MGAPAVDRLEFRGEVTAADINAIRRLVAATGLFNREEIAVAEGLVGERLAKGPASGYEFVIAQREGVMVGYACFGPVAGTQASYDLYWIVAAPQFQRMGIGRRLLGEVERRIAAAGGRRIYAETSGREQYAPTRAFYQRMGFRQEAVLPDFFAPGDDKVIFVKLLRSESRAT